MARPADPVAIVTGGSCGAGRDIARKIGGRGYAVVVVYLRDQGEAEAGVDEILAASGTALAVRADVCDELDVERLFDETKAAFGGVDVVVHTAMRGASVVNRQAARRLRRGGAIVDVSSSDAIAPVLARELDARDITVNGLAPGLEPPDADHDTADLVAFLDHCGQPRGLTRAFTGANGGRKRDADATKRNQRRSLMSSTQQSNDTATEASGAVAVPMRIEVVVVPVSGVDRAKSFYQGLGWRLDADISAGDDYHLVQMTPPASNASIIFGKGVTSDPPGSIGSLLLAVDDIEAARDELISHGVDVEVFHDAGGSVGGGFIADKASRAPGPDPERRSYASYASFSDPDGNGWLLQEITERLPGRV